MEAIEAFLRLCASAAAVLAIVLAYDTTRKDLDELKKSIERFAEKDDETVGGRDVRGDRDQGE